MTRKICRHIKTNGRRCGSPSLNRNELCYFHARLFARERVLRQPLPPALFPGNPASPLPAQLTEIDLPTLEDAESIQVSISLLVSALALNRIDSKTRRRPPLRPPARLHQRKIHHHDSGILIWPTLAV